MSSLAGKRQHPGRIDAWDKALRKLVREVAICEVQKTSVLAIIFKNLCHNLVQVPRPKK